jgi:hypothetical protein
LQLQATEVATSAIKVQLEPAKVALKTAQVATHAF